MAGRYVPARRRNYTVVIFCITASLLYADQNLMAPNLTAIAQDFGFDDAQRDKYLGGYIAAAFYMVGAPAALLFGYLSDTSNRRNLLFAAVLLGEGPCILTFFVTRYWQLLVCASSPASRWEARCLWYSASWETCLSRGSARA